MSLYFASPQTEETVTQREDGAPGKKKRKKKKKKAKGDDAEAETEEPAYYQEPPKFEVNQSFVFIPFQFKSKTHFKAFKNVLLFCCLFVLSG